MRRLWILMIFLPVAFLSGCFLERIFKSEDTDSFIQAVASPEYSISGVVNVPASGAAKTSAGKFAYKVESGVTVYLLSASLSDAGKLDYRNKYLQKTLTNASGYYKFSGLTGGSYCVVIDVNDDGKCESFVDNITPSENGKLVDKFIRDLSQQNSCFFSANLEKDTYRYGEEIKVTVTGYTQAAKTIHLELWNENSSENYVWKSDPANVTGTVNQVFTKTVPTGWAGSNSTLKPDYRLCVTVDENQLTSSAITINETSAGDTTAPASGNSGAIAAANLATTSVDLSWTAAADDTGSSAECEYIVYRSAAANIDTLANCTSNGTVIKNWTNSLTSFAVTGLTPVTDYWFNVVVNDGRGNKTAYTMTHVKTLNPDTTPPTVVSVTSTTANGTYAADAQINLTVLMSEAVILDNAGGAPRLLIETGATDRYALYQSGSGSDTLVFQYTVTAGDVSSDLDYVSVNALEANGSTIKDAADNPADLALPNPGGANSLGASKAIVIDTQAPVISVLTPLDNASPIDLRTTITIAFNENITRGTGNIVLKKASDNSVFQTINVTDTGKVSISGAQSTITINALSYATQYYVQIDATCYKDSVNNSFAGIADTTTWDFTIGQPDLRIVGAECYVISWNNGPIYADADVAVPGYTDDQVHTVYVKFINAGTARSPKVGQDGRNPETGVVIQLGPGYIAYNLEEFYLPALLPNQSTFKYFYALCETEGPKTATFTVDAANDIQESDETNNTFIINYVVLPEADMP